MHLTEKCGGNRYVVGAVGRGCTQTDCALLNVVAGKRLEVTNKALVLAQDLALALALASACKMVMG